MISHLDQVQVSYILHQAIHHAECKMKKVLIFPFFVQKNKLIRVLYQSRILFARFLVIYRWLKRKPSIKIDNGKSSPTILEIYFLNLLNCFKNFSSIQKNQQQINISSKFDFFEVYKKEIISKINYQENLFQILCDFLEPHKSIKHIKSINVIKKYIVINSYPFYYLILKIKPNFCRIVRLNLHWNNIFDFPSDYLKILIKRLSPIDLKRPNELFRIDSYIYSFCVINFFATIVKELIKYSDSFQCRIIRQNDNSVLIIFREIFIPFNQFVLKIQNSNQIYIHSKTPLFIIPEDLRTIDETFEKLSSDEKVIPKKIYNRKIEILEDFSAPSLLSEMKDLVFYTRIRHFWNFLKGAARSSFFAHNRLLLQCNTNSISGISIKFADHLNNYVALLTIVFDSVTCQALFLPISKFYKIEKVDSSEDISKTFHSIFIHFIGHIDFSHMFKSHIFALMRPFFVSDLKVAKINFSFSDTFFIEQSHSFSFPSFRLRRLDQPENLNPRTILIKHFIRSDHKKSDFDDLMSNLATTTKIYLILLEVEWRLKSRGISTKRDVNVLYIPLLGCKFKIDINEFWSISFEKPLSQYISSGRMTIIGNKLTLRFVDSMINLIEDCSKIGLFTYLIRHEVVYNEDRKIYFKKFGIHFIILFEPFRNDFYKDEPLFHYFTTHEHIYPQIKLRSLMYTAPPVFYNYIENEDVFSGYLNRDVYYQFMLLQIFNSPKWKIVPILNNDSMIIVYKNDFFMTVHKLPDASHLGLYVSSISQSSLLLVPIGNLFKIDESRPPIFSVKLTIFEMEKVKNEIEKYIDLLLEYKIMKIDQFSYSKGQIIGKGIRFYLIKVVFNSNGIIASSPSFPSLALITTSINKLEINFESKKKIFMFIISILKADDREIVGILGILKNLVSHQFINNLDWEKMSDFMAIYLDNSEITLQFLIAEKNDELFLYYDDQANCTVLVKKGGKEKRYPIKEFDDIYMNLNPNISIYDQFIL